MAAELKHYEHFTAPERIILLLEALARGDMPESDRLSQACPRKSYTQRDAAFGDRLDTAFDVMAIACIDLRCLWGKLDVLRWAIAVHRQTTTHHQIISTMAFLEGSFHGQGRPQMEFFAEGAGEANDGDDVDESDATPDEKLNPLSPVLQGELGKRMGAVEDRAQGVTDGSCAELLLAAQQIAQQLAEVWAGFDAFCRSRLGVPATTLLSAWEFPTGAEVVEMLAYHRHVKPEPAKVEEYRTIYCRAWDRKFGEHR